MGCQADVELGKNLTFSICTHSPVTGVLTAADSNPAYRVYEDETATAILTGTMTTLDAGNTTGFYTEQIACTVANGFEADKSYNIYITATVGGDTGGFSYSFRCFANVADAVWDEAIADHLDVGSTGAKLNACSTVVVGDIADAVWDETLADHLSVGSTGAKLNATTAFGTGINTWTYTVTDADTGGPIDNVEVWVTTDSAGVNIVASGTTDAFGVVTFYLDSGTFYIWRKKAGYNFVNPDQEVVS